MARVPELPSRTPADPTFNDGRLAARAAGSIDAHVAALNAITNAAPTKRNGSRRLDKRSVVVAVRLMSCVPSHGNRRIRYRRAKRVPTGLWSQPIGGRVQRVFN